MKITKHNAKRYGINSMQKYPKKVYNLVKPKIDRKTQKLVKKAIFDDAKQEFVQVVEDIPEVPIEKLRKQKSRWIDKEVNRLTNEYLKHLFLNGNSDALESERIRLSDLIEAEKKETKRANVSRKKLTGKEVWKFEL